MGISLIDVIGQTEADGDRRDVFCYFAWEVLTWADRPLAQLAHRIMRHLPGLTAV
jgi:hypothetical protein